MSRLASRLSAITLFLLLVFLLILVSPRSKSGEMKNISNLMQLPGLSLSTSYIEDRIPSYSDNTNIFYINMKSDNYAGFVYAK